MTYQANKFLDTRGQVVKVLVDGVSVVLEVADEHGVMLARLFFDPKAAMVLSTVAGSIALQCTSEEDSVASYEEAIQRLNECLQIPKDVDVVPHVQMEHVRKAVSNQSPESHWGVAPACNIINMREKFSRKEIQSDLFTE